MVTWVGAGCATLSGMSVGRFENTIYSPHMVTPDRVIVPISTDRQVIPAPRPFDAAPGVVPFHRMLESLNRVPKVDEAEQTRNQIPRGADIVELSSAMTNTPKIGEVLPVTPIAPSQPPQVAQKPHIEPPMTGSVLDLYL